MRSRLSSLRYRIIISVVVIETVMLSIMVGSNASQVRQTHQDRLDQSVQVILQQFAATAGRYLFEVDYPSLQEYADNILAHDELAYLLVEDANGNLVTASGELPNVELLQAGLDDARTDIHEVRGDVVLGGKRRGEVRLGFTTAVRDAAVAAALRRGFLIAAIEIVLSIIVALLIGSMLTKNLTLLAHFAGLYGRGERDLIVPINSFDETGMLANAFNEMVRQRQAAELKKSESDIRQAILQNELLHASRLSAMGQLSAQIAHEINQPLAAIMNYLHASRQMIESRADGASEQITEMLDKAIKQTDRTATIIWRLRRFVSKGDTNPSVEDVNEIVLEAVDLALVSVPDGYITKTLKLADGLSPVSIDKTQIVQVVVNLVRNAVEAMADSPTRQLTVETSQSGAEAIEIAIGDSGPGVAAEIADRLFQPFVSDKKGGMGIGLSISHSFIEAHGGQLKAGPNMEGGTIFRFTLPAAQKEQERNVA